MDFIEKLGSVFWCEVFVAAPLLLESDGKNANLDEPHTNWAPTQNNLNHLWLEFAAGRSTGFVIAVIGELSSLAGWNEKGIRLKLQQ